jgi:hypothetical protein
MKKKQLINWMIIKKFSFLVAENRGHGMQVVNLETLVNMEIPSSPLTLTEDAYYDQFGNAHNIALNVDTGFAYVVGTKTCQLVF